MKTLRDFLAKLKETKEDGATPARPHDGVLRQQPGRRQQPRRARTCRSLLAGGGFKHGQHLAFDPKSPPPLCNLLRHHAPATRHWRWTSSRRARER